MIPHKFRRHRGVTAMLAMLYLVLFSTLALGFYATTTTAVQVSNNDVKITRALTAAESGIEFTNYHMARLNIPPNTPTALLFQTVYQNLATRLNGTANLPSSAKGQTIEKVAGVGPTGLPIEIIYIPARTTSNEPTYIALDGSTDFRAEIRTKESATSAEEVEVYLYGKYSSTQASRGVQINYANIPNPTKIFNYGVASKSSITLNSNARIVGATSAEHGSVLSTSTSLPAITMKANAEVSGDIAVSSTDPNALSIDANAHIGGTAQSGVDEPEFPTIDTSEFKTFAGSAAGYGGTTITLLNQNYKNQTLRNVYIRANTNPTFDTGCIVQGVVYIEAPNQVTFGSNSSVTGAIVVDNTTSVLGTPATNLIKFESNTTINEMSDLPTNQPAYFPPEMLALTGSMILAPNFTIQFNSNFGAFGGSVVGSNIEFRSNAVGTIKGTIINLNSNTGVQFNSNSVITVESQGTAHYPAGVKFGSRYSPLPDTYKEIIQ